MNWRTPFILIFLSLPICLAGQAPEILPGNPNRALRQAAHALALVSLAHAGEDRLALIDLAEACGQTLPEAGFGDPVLLNERAVLQIVKAITLDDTQSVPFPYPLVFSMSAPLEADVFPLAGHPAGSLAERAMEIDASLTRAETFLRHAIHQNREYSPPYINLGIVYDLRDQYEPGYQQAGRAIEFMPDSTDARRALLFKMAGIYFYHTGDTAKTRLAFNEAQTLGAAFAGRDLAILTGGPVLPEPAAEHKPDSRQAEMIRGMPPAKYFADLEYPEANQVALHDSLATLAFRPASDGALTLRLDCRAANRPWPVVHIEIVDSSSHRQVGPGIETGASRAEVVAAFGEPNRVVAAEAAEYLVYTGPALIFAIDYSTERRLTRYMHFCLQP